MPPGTRSNDRSVERLGGSGRSDGAGLMSEMTGLRDVRDGDGLFLLGGLGWQRTLSAAHFGSDHFEEQRDRDVDFSSCEEQRDSARAGRMG